MSAGLNDSSSLDDFQREINSKRHALLDAEAKIEGGTEETKGLAKELEGSETKLKEAEEALAGKADEVALLQVGKSKSPENDF